MEDNIIVDWFYWHFYEVPKFLLQIWKNFVLFSTNFFSVPLLLKTLFSPWRRYKWSYPRGFDIGKYLETIISNLFSRFMGAICRIFLIIIGLIFQIFVIIAGAFLFVGWLFLPILLLMLLLFSLNII